VAVLLFLFRILTIRLFVTNDNSSISSDGFQDLKKKSLSGMSALFVRQILIKVIFFAGNVILARILAPQIFGIYAIVNFVVTFFSTFGDVGIGAALIQKKGELSREELSTTFWLQQMLVWIVVVIVTFAAPLALKVYPTLPPEGIWLIRAMALSFLFSSLKTIPAVLMERKVDFKRIAWVDITENLAFQSVVISCAFMGLGAWSFILAAITRGLLGAVLIYALSPWRPSLQYRFESVKGLVNFGLPYQGYQILCFLKDAVTPLFVGAYVGAAAVGYLNWARNFAFMPLVISETFGRVAFPAFSKLQGEAELMTSAIERSIRMMTLVMFPVTAIMVALGPDLTHVVFTDKWIAGLNAFYLYCISPAFIGIFLPIYSGIMSLGKSRVMLMITLGLIVFEWGVGVPLVLAYGFTGVAMTQPVTVPVFGYAYWLILRRNNIKVSVLCNIRSQFMYALLAAGFARLAMSQLQINLIGILVSIIVGSVSYLILLMTLNRTLLDEFLSYVRLILSKKKSVINL
jgi:O-antigen/teichoic acid export membrane protein